VQGKGILNHGWSVLPQAASYAKSNVISVSCVLAKSSTWGRIFAANSDPFRGTKIFSNMILLLERYDDINNLYAAANMMPGNENKLVTK
jgi:hypothetical protein